MNKIFLYLSIALISMSSYKTNSEMNSSTNKISTEANLNDSLSIFHEVKYDNIKSDYSENSEVKSLDLLYGKTLLKLRFIEDKTFLAIDHENKEMMNWSIIQFNSNYDINLPTAEKSIHFLSNGESDFKNYILFPAPTEEFPSYYLYHFDGKTITFKGFYASRKMSASDFSYDESNRKLMQNDSGKDIPLEFISNQLDLPEFSEDDLKKIQASATKKPSNQLKDLIASNQFLVKEFDVNKDGVSDKILSHLPYKGDQLYIFLSDKNSKNLKLAIETINFSEDGGNQVTDIRPTNTGFELITDFPDRGKYQFIYQIDYKNNSFELAKLTTESYSHQNQTSEFCNRELNINLNSDLNKIFQAIESATPVCKTVKQ